MLRVKCAYLAQRWYCGELRGYWRVVCNGSYRNRTGMLDRIKWWAAECSAVSLGACEMCGLYWADVCLPASEVGPCCMTLCVCVCVCVSSSSSAKSAVCPAHLFLYFVLTLIIETPHHEMLFIQPLGFALLLGWYACASCDCTVP
jgi:hypothetical protein